MTPKERLDELHGCFISSGYPKYMVKGILNEVLGRKMSLKNSKRVEKAPFPVVWVQTFGPATPVI